MAGSELSCPRARWVTITKAMPVSGGTPGRNPSNALSPPAEAPMPTIGKQLSAGRQLSALIMKPHVDHALDATNSVNLHGLDYNPRPAPGNDRISQAPR